MTTYGLDQKEFSYIKRKGRIFIQSTNPEIQFGYLRKKITHLNPFTKQWEYGSFYKLQINANHEIEVNDWSQVKNHFEQWLSSSLKGHL